MQNFPSHYPAHESLQEYAIRRGIAIDVAYASWSNRSYPAFSVPKTCIVGGVATGRELMSYAAKGPGLKLWG